MTKENARKILEQYLAEKAYMSIDEFNSMPSINLPIIDEVVYHKISFDKNTSINEEWTFKGLIKLIYDLND